MKVSFSWLKQFVDFNLPPEELADKLSLGAIGVKEQTQDYLELDLTYNRGDLLSLRGVAREVAAVTNSKLSFSALKSSNYPWEGKNLPKNLIQVDDKNLCPVYCVAKIEELKIEHSSDEWVKKLKDSGIRSVNNAADVTNLIMLEYGQPMHAFDASRVKDETLIVRTAEKGEKIITLDGKERTLHETDLLIADPEKALGLAGVMGGKNSEVSEQTKTILLEAAIFDPIANRQTSKRHGLYSEATKRFQHGLTRTNLLQALAAAIEMYEDLGGKLTAITLIGDLKDGIKTIKLTQEKIKSLIGIEIPSAEVESSLKKLGFSLTVQDSAWEVTVPYFRLDIQIEEDLIEEVARMYGYEKISPKELKGQLPEKIDQSFLNFIYDLKKALAGAGLTEVQTYSFFSTIILNNLDLDRTRLVKIANPISSETEYMRDNLWPNLLEVVDKNLRGGYKDIVIFEIGKTYSPQKGNLPKEGYHLSIALMNGTDNPIQELYLIFQSVISHPGGVTKGIGTENKYFHPTRFAALAKDGKQIGWIAEIHPRIANKFGIEKRVAVLEIEIVMI